MFIFRVTITVVIRSNTAFSTSMKNEAKGIVILLTIVFKLVYECIACNNSTFCHLGLYDIAHSYSHRQS